MQGKHLGLIATLTIAVLTMGLPTANAAAFHVHIQGFAFNPRDLTVNVGDTVTWDNHDGATHTTTDSNCPRAGGPGPCEWDSLNMATGVSFSHTFNTGGFFTYECTIHGFTGTLTVVDPNAKPDLRVSALTVADAPAPNTLTQKRLTATVVNDGTAGSPTTDVLFSYVYQGTWNTISQPNVDPVPVGGTRAVTATWTTMGKIGDFTIRAFADSQNQIVELNEENNVRTAAVSLVTPPGLVPGTDLLDPI